MLTRQQIQEYRDLIGTLGFPTSPVPASTSAIFTRPGELAPTPAGTNRVRVNSHSSRSGCAISFGIVATSNGGNVRIAHVQPGGWEIALNKISAATERLRETYAALRGLIPAPAPEEPISEQVSLIRKMLKEGKFRGQESAIAELASILLAEPLSAFGSWAQSESHDSAYGAIAPETVFGHNNFTFAAFRPLPGPRGIENPQGHNIPLGLDSLLIPECSAFHDFSGGSNYRAIRLTTHRRIVRDQVQTELRCARSSMINLRYLELFQPAPPSELARLATLEQDTLSHIELPGATPLPVSMIFSPANSAEAIMEILMQLFTLPPDAP